jgi:predicted lipase
LGAISRVKANYPGRTDEISLHSGFALYLMRQRKDSGKSKLDEIFEKVDTIGREMAPDGSYKLCVCGHSLGGALATLFGFYVAAKPMFKNLSTVYIWTYASPTIGTEGEHVQVFISSSIKV